MEVLTRENMDMGGILLEYNLITEEQLKDAEIKSQKSNKKLREILIDLGYTTESAINYVLSSKLNLPYVHLSYQMIDPEVVKSVPAEILKRYKMIPIIRVDNELNLIMADPTDDKAIEDVKSITGCDIKVSLGLSSEIMEIIDQVFGKKALTEKKEIEAKPEDKIMEDTSGVAFVYYHLTQALTEGVSEVYVEPMADSLRIRYRRIDGSLYEKDRQPLSFHLPVLSRIKLMANMDLLKEKVPQESNIQTKLGNKETNLRISTLFTHYGEACVIRILQRDVASIGLGNLGIDPLVLRQLKVMMDSSSGVGIVTGSTGSGRSTTAYALLKEINSTQNRIVTIENFISYPEEGFIQVESTKEQDTLSALKIAITQNSDVIMIEDMNQNEIINLCFNEVLADRLILGQMNYGYAFDVIDHLFRIGVSPTLIASTLLFIIGQRKIRLLCENCKEPYPAPSKLNLKESTLYRAKGCNMCNKTGYQGCSYIHEVLVINEKMKSLLRKKEPLEKIEELAVQEGFISLKESGMKKVLSGVTSLEEVMNKSSLYEEVI